MSATAKEAIEMLKAAYNEQVQVCAEVLKYLFTYIQGCRTLPHVVMLE